MLSQIEVRYLNQGTPVFDKGTTFARNTNPEEIRRLIAETRAKFIGPFGMAEVRRKLEPPVVAAPKDDLNSISVF